MPKQTLKIDTHSIKAVDGITYTLNDLKGLLFQYQSGTNVLPISDVAGELVKLQALIVDAEKLGVVMQTLTDRPDLTPAQLAR